MNTFDPNIIFNIFIKSTFNNTFISFTNESGQVKFSVSAGMVGLKGSKKKTPLAAQKIMKICVKRAKDLGIKKVRVFLEGQGKGREIALKTLLSNRFTIVEISEKNLLPHNGCRPPKKRSL